MRYALMTTITAAAMVLGVAASFAQGAGEQPLRDCLQRAVNAPQAPTAVSECIARRFLSENVAPLSTVSFEMRKGAVLPATVTLNLCPKDVIPMLGGFRGECRFVVVGNRVVVVEQSTRTVFGVLPVQ
jgi:Protein of unknown function (DUF1236)